MSPSVKFMVLGHPRLERDNQALVFSRRRALALLAYLAITHRAHSRDSLVNLLYPDLDESAGRAEFRRILSALKTTLPDDVLEVDRETITLSKALWVDVDAFGEAITADTIDSLSDAVALYGDGFMVGFNLPDSALFDDWQFEQRESFRQRFIRCMRRLVDHYTEQREFERAIEYAKQWIAQDTLDEIAYRTLMRLYVKANQAMAALRVYEDFARLAASELQVEPEAETTRLYEMIKVNRGDMPTIGLLPPQPRMVVGRDGVLKDLKSRLDPNTGTGRSTVTILQGWPGVGKTTTLSALAHDARIEDLFPDGVLWTSLGATPNLHAELSLWAAALGIKTSERSSTLESLTTQIRSALHQRQMLILVDDVWAVSHAMFFQVSGPNCALMMSTRQNDIANAFASTADDIYKLPVLSEDSALDLLNQLAPMVIEAHPDAARALVRDLEGLPLALQVAGRLLRTESQNGWGIEELLTELRDGTKLLSSQPPADVAYMQASPTIAALLRKSTDSLTPEMRARFIYLGMFAPKPATYDLPALAVAWGERDPRPAIRILVDRGLLEPAQAGRFQMHALLVMHARTLAERIE